MARLTILPGQRLHMSVWRSSIPQLGGLWLAAGAVNGIPVEGAEAFATWREAYDYAHERSSG